MPAVILEPLVELRTAPGDEETSQEVAAVRVERIVEPSLGDRALEPRGVAIDGALANRDLVVPSAIECVVANRRAEKTKCLPQGCSCLRLVVLRPEDRQDRVAANEPAPASRWRR